MVVSQGELFWVDFGEPRGSETGYRRPVVVVQNNDITRSKIETLIVCPLSSNIRLALSEGNVLLKKGEGNLTKPSVVNVSQIFTINKIEVGNRIGVLPKMRVAEIIAGIAAVLRPSIL